MRHVMFEKWLLHARFDKKESKSEGLEQNLILYKIKETSTIMKILKLIIFLSALMKTMEIRRKHMGERFYRSLKTRS